jgi:hypothetical protein
MNWLLRRGFSQDRCSDGTGFQDLEPPAGISAGSRHTISVRPSPRFAAWAAGSREDYIVQAWALR